MKRPASENPGIVKTKKHQWPEHEYAVGPDFTSGQRTGFVINAAAKAPITVSRCETKLSRGRVCGSTRAIHLLNPSRYACAGCGQVREVQA